MQRPVKIVRESESTCLGVGMLASAAVGIHSDIESAAKSMSATSSSFESDPARVGMYQDLYDAYRMIYPALRNIFPAISKSLKVE